MSVLAERLKVVRTLLGESQKGMSKRLSLGINAWSRYENGQNMPGADVIEAIARLGFNGHWLLTGDGTPNFKKDGYDTPDPYRQPIEHIEVGLQERSTPFVHRGQSEKPYLPVLMKAVIVGAQRAAKQKIQSEEQTYTFQEVADLVLQMYDAVVPTYTSGTNTTSDDAAAKPGDVWP